MLKDDPRALLFHARDDAFAKVNFNRISYWNPTILLIKWPSFGADKKKTLFYQLDPKCVPPRNQVLKDDPRALLFHARDDAVSTVNFCRSLYWNTAIHLLKVADFWYE